VTKVYVLLEDNYYSGQPEPEYFCGVYATALDALEAAGEYACQGEDYYVEHLPEAGNCSRVYIKRSYEPDEELGMTEYSIICVEV
jgi:hypothetical protein